MSMAMYIFLYNMLVTVYIQTFFAYMRIRIYILYFNILFEQTYVYHIYETRACCYIKLIEAFNWIEQIFCKYLNRFGQYFKIYCIYINDIIYEYNIIKDRFCYIIYIYKSFLYSFSPIIYIYILYYVYIHLIYI